MVVLLVNKPCIGSHSLDVRTRLHRTYDSSANGSKVGVVQHEQSSLAFFGCAVCVSLFFIAATLSWVFALDLCHVNTRYAVVYFFGKNHPEKKIM